MTMQAKNINYFLMNGTYTGRVKCTMLNWTGVAYKIPRVDIDRCKEREDLSQSGVYFLFGADESDNEVVYVGQAGMRKTGEGLFKRLQEHIQDTNKNYWTEAVVFTTSNNSFGPTEINCLESRFYWMAKGAERYEMDNLNEPPKSNATEEKESELEEFIEMAAIVMCVLGHKVFVPLANASSTNDGTEQALSRDFYINRGGVEASALLTSDGIVVLAGSKIQLMLQHTCPVSAKNEREKYKDSINSEGVLEKNILFKTPSSASSFVIGGSTNGNVEWKTKEGVTLREVNAKLSSDD